MEATLTAVKRETIGKNEARRLRAAGQVPGIAPAHGIAAVSSVGYFGMMVGPPAIGFIAQARSLAAGLLLVIVFAVVVAAFSRRALGTRP